MSNLEFTKDELVAMAIGQMAGAASVQTSTEMNYCKRLASQALFYLKQNEALKKDLLNLLPIARGNAYEILSSESFSTGFEVQCERYIEFFDELTAKYAEGK